MVGGMEGGEKEKRKKKVGGCSKIKGKSGINGRGAKV